MAAPSSSGRNRHGLYSYLAAARIERPAGSTAARVKALVPSLFLCYVRHLRKEAHMEDFGLDRQGALVLAIGWLAALWITLT